MEALIMEREILKDENLNISGNASLVEFSTHFSAHFSWSIPFSLTASLLSVIFLLSFIGNSSVLLVMLKVPRMRTRMNVLLTNLSVSSLLLTTLCLPFLVLENFFQSGWIFGEGWCKSLFSFLCKIKTWPYDFKSKIFKRLSCHRSKPWMSSIV